MLWTYVLLTLLKLWQKGPTAYLILPQLQDVLWSEPCSMCCPSQSWGPGAAEVNPLLQYPLFFMQCTDTFLHPPQPGRYQRAI